MDIEIASQPRTTFELFGHEEAEQLFLNPYNAGKLHHAWMITGPRGVGKATLGYKIARFLLNNPPIDEATPGLFGDVIEKEIFQSLDTDPLSRPNQLVSAGSHPDLMVIEKSEDPKTGKMRGKIVIDEVRKLNGFYQKTSADGGWRIALIDTADDMNRNAANGILKILEEPPKNSILILLVNAPGKLLPTIKSRCRMLRLSPLVNETVRKILQKDFPMLDKTEIDFYASLSDGSPGYAVSLVEHKGIELYTMMLNLLSSLPALDVPLCHAFADSMTSQKSGNRFQLFGDLLTRFINRMIRHVSFIQTQHKLRIAPALDGEFQLMERLGAIIPLDQWAELWEKISQKLAQVDHLNMDKKHTVIDIFTMINSATRV